MTRFGSVSLSPELRELIYHINEDFKGICTTIEVNCPNSREKSLAITKIEEASMWANKAISNQMLSQEEKCK